MSPISTDTVTGDVDVEDSGIDNPFRPDGGLAREAAILVELIKAGKPITPTSPTQEEIKELEALKAEQQAIDNKSLNNQSNVNSPVGKGKSSSNSSASSPSSPSSKKSSPHSSPSNGCVNQSTPVRSKGSLNGNNNNNNYNGKKPSLASPKGSMVLSDDVDKNSLAAKKNSKRACCVVQ